MTSADAEVRGSSRQKAWRKSKEEIYGGSDMVQEMWKRRKQRKLLDECRCVAEVNSISERKTSSR